MPVGRLGCMVLGVKVWYRVLWWHDPSVGEEDSFSFSPLRCQEEDGNFSPQTEGTIGCVPFNKKMYGLVFNSSFGFSKYLESYLVIPCNTSCSSHHAFAVFPPRTRSETHLSTTPSPKGRGRGGAASGSSERAG